MTINKSEFNPNQPKENLSSRESDDSEKMPYELLTHKKLTKKEKKELKEKLGDLSDAQVYALQQCAIDFDCKDVIKIIEEERPGDLSKALENLTLEQKYEIAKSTRMPEAFCPFWIDSEYEDLIEIEKMPDEESKTNKMKKILSQHTEETLRATAGLFEEFMRDYDTAKIFRDELDRRQNLVENLKREKHENRIEQEIKANRLKESLHENPNTMPYGYLYHSKWDEEDKHDFREALKDLSDAQLYILKQDALINECDIAVKIIEEERPGDLGKALENLTLEQKYELAKSTEIPEAYCPEWFDCIYDDLIRRGKIGAYSDEELGAFSWMLEYYMRDSDTAEILRKEYDKRKHNN